jgi:RNA polymerase sigma factor (sigma-70 family)
MSSGVNPAYALKSFRKDELLVRECLLGSEQAWSDLIDKYSNLIFSIAIKYGFSRDDAREIFQAVCLTLLQELSHLREPRALAAWLIKRLRRRREGQAFVGVDIESEEFASSGQLHEAIIEGLEREQILREAIAEASPECRRLISLLFFADPPLRYEQAAAVLGFAKGSIGATRMRCLERLRSSLEKKGFR